MEYIDSQVNQKYDVNTGVQIFEMLILCELCEGGFTLINMIEYCKKKVPEHVVLSIMKDICHGVQFMHYKGMAHRDLKVENILLKN